MKYKIDEFFRGIKIFMTTQTSFPLTFSSAVEMYFIAKRAQRLSEHTLKDYTNTFNKFSRFVGNEREINSIDASIVAGFLAEFTLVSKKTTLNYHTGLSSLWNYLVEVGLAEKNIVRLVKPPRPDERQILPFTRLEIVALLKAVEDGKPRIRNRAIILLLLDCGIRSSELCSLKLKNINLDNRRMIIRGKGDKERKIPFSETTQAALKLYIQVRGLHATRNYHDAVFISASGNVIDRIGLLQIIERVGIKAGVLNSHPHRFRHTFAIQFLRNGGNIYTLQALLGHTTLDMVKRYLAIAQMDIDRDHDKASPVKHWGL